MWKDEMMICVLSLAALSAAGCKSHVSMENRPPMAAQEMSSGTVSPDQVPSDVVHSMHMHVRHASIISAQTMMWKGAILYQLCVKSGNNIYMVKIRPDGNYLGMSFVGERP